MKTSKLLADNNPLGPALQRYFCHYLIGQRDVSPQTVNAYRDTFKLLLRFLEKRYRKKADNLSVLDLSASRILAFLDDLVLPFAQRLLAIPLKRIDHCDVGYLSREQMQTLLAAPDGSTKTGLRDRVLLMLMYNTGARVSEIAALKIGDLHFNDGGAIHIRGKGRKQRSVPLWRRTVRLLRQWLKEVDDSPDKPLLPNSRGTVMTRAGVAQRLRHAVHLAAQRDFTIRKRRVSPHTIRHTTAMHMLQAGVDLSVIALWLGHESIQTTHQYLQADLETKKKALSAVEPPNMSRSTRTSPTPLFQFLEGL